MTPITAEYRWRPIEDYERDPLALGKQELRQLAEIWQDQRQTLYNSQGLNAFNQRLRREWSIETGLLERIYSLDRGITEVLIERGLEESLIPRDVAGQDPARVVAILRDHDQSIDFLFDVVNGTRTLSTAFVKELHALLTRNQPTSAAIDSQGRKVEVPLVRGAYKKLPNNPSRPDGTVHEYCPPEHVDSEMDHLLDLHSHHGSVASEVEAAWLHHRFTQIHPFQDGNGRLARALATLVFIRAGWFPLVIRDLAEEKTRYLDALEAADRGDLSPLVAVFAAAQRKAFVQALGISSQILKHRQVDQVIVAARSKLEAREAARRLEWETAKTTAQHLQDLARKRLEGVAAALRRETQPLLQQPKCFVDSGGDADGRGHYFRNQIVQTAKALGYFANLAEYRQWLRLVLETDTRTEILLSFHGTGHEFRGILAVSACLFRREQTESGDREISGVTPLASEIFQVNYKEPSDQAAERFAEWLEDVLIRGLEVWRQGI
jgi:Fic family protein